MKEKKQPKINSKPVQIQNSPRSSKWSYRGYTIERERYLKYSPYGNSYRNSYTVRDSKGKVTEVRSYRSGIRVIDKQLGNPTTYVMQNLHTLLYFDGSSFAATTVGAAKVFPAPVANSVWENFIWVGI